MRCNKHPVDYSSTVGVCASCLRERLVAIMAVQAQNQLLQAKLYLARDRNDIRKSDTDQAPSLAFSCAVSPYIFDRKSDAAAAWKIHGNYNQRFYDTPQMRPTSSFTVEMEKRRKSNGGKFVSRILGLFRSKGGKTNFDYGPKSVSKVPGPIGGIGSRDPCIASPNRRKNNISTFSLDANVIGDQRRAGGHRGHGMSPESFSDGEEDEHCRGGSSGSSSESSQSWRQTPRRTPASVRGGGGRAAACNKNISGLTFFLSPLVRSSPQRQSWGQKVMPPESPTAGAYSSDSRAPPKRRLCTTSTSFGKNRSRKLADFGRYHPHCRDFQHH